MSKGKSENKLMDKKAQEKAKGFPGKDGQKINPKKKSIGTQDARKLNGDYTKFTKTFE